MSRFQLLGGLLVFLVGAAGCTHKQPARANLGTPRSGELNVEAYGNGASMYRLLRVKGGPVMVPPGVASPNLIRRTFVARIAPGRGSCAADSAITVQPQPRRKSLRVTVDRDALLQQQEPGWLIRWTMRAEAQGCIASGTGEELGRLIADSVPLDPAAAFQLLHAPWRSPYVDLGSDNRLQVHSPVLREGMTDAVFVPELSRVSGSGNRLDVDLKPAPNVIGVETAWYAVRRNTGRLGYHFEPLFADRTIQGNAEHLAGPAINLFQFPPRTAFFRLLYKTDANGVVAIVAHGTTREELDRGTEAVLADSAACEKHPELCRVLPRSVGVNAFIAASVNGGEVTVPIRSLLSNAIEAAGVKDPASVLLRLKVTKPYEGKPVPVVFDPTCRDILDVPLNGGEQIYW